MALAVVNYPIFSQGDFAWIQSVRREYDMLYFHIINPHFTIVFPTDNVSQQALIEHVRKHACENAPFKVVMRCAILGDPDFQEHAHVFLVPDEGFSDIVRLHDCLYTGLLAGELRLDIPFIPHIAIANTPELEDSKAIVDRLNGESFEIRANVEQLDVIGYDGKRVWTIEQVPLGPTDWKEA